METKKLTVPFNLIEVKEQSIAGQEFFTFKGYASTFNNVDLVEDIMEKGCFLDSLGKRKPKLLWQHQMDEPLGVFSDIHEDEKGLFVEGRLPKADSFVSGRVIPQMKTGSIDSMSIGFSVVDSEFIDVNGLTLRKLKSVDLWEISLVTIPANPAAKITNMKTVVPYKNLPLAERNMAWSRRNAERRVRDWSDSESGAIAPRFKNAFLWYDKEDAQNFGAYKLMIGDIVDGELKAVPRAVFAAAAAMRGARGGVDIPDSDRSGVIRNINRYYAKMREEFDDDSIISPFEKSLSNANEFGTIKDVSKYLKANGFSKSETDDIVYFIKEHVKSCKEAEQKESTPCNEEDGKLLEELTNFTRRLKNG